VSASATRTVSRTPGNRKTQRAAILRLLIDARGAWVPLPEIMACAAQYNARIHELRRIGFNIPKPRIEHVNGETHSWYRLIKSPALETLEPAAPKSAWGDRRRITGLPLFDLASGGSRV
jgi:hypothetical protein